MRRPVTRYRRDSKRTNKQGLVDLREKVIGTEKEECIHFTQVLFHYKFCSFTTVSVLVLYSFRNNEHQTPSLFMVGDSTDSPSGLSERFPTLPPFFIQLVERRTLFRVSM